jgi:hypothetical protein
VTGFGRNDEVLGGVGITGNGQMQRQRPLQNAGFSVAFGWWDKFLIPDEISGGLRMGFQGLWSYFYGTATNLVGGLDLWEGAFDGLRWVGINLNFLTKGRLRGYSSRRK